LGDQCRKFLQDAKTFLVVWNGKGNNCNREWVCFKDKLQDGRIADEQRINYFAEYLAALKKAKQEGVNVKGYFAWTLMDNFEWNEGYNARFGLIHVDFATQLRTIKDSGYWWRDFLNRHMNLTRCPRLSVTYFAQFDILDTLSSLVSSPSIVLPFTLVSR